MTEFKRSRIEDAEKQIINIKHRIDDNTVTPNELLVLGNIYFDRKEFDESLKYYEKSFKLKPMGEVSYKIAKILLEQKEYKFALYYYDRAIELGDSSEGIFSDRGWINLKLGNYDKAIDDFTTAISLSPRDALNYFYRGFLYEKKGTFDKVLSDYSESIGLVPNNAEAYYERGKLYLTLNQEQNAISDFEKAGKFNPQIKKETDVVLQKYMKDKQVREEIKLNEEKRKKEKELEIQRRRREKVEFVRLLQLGKGQLELGENLRAVHTLNDALKLNTESAEAFFRRGEAWWNLDEISKALSDFNRASSIDKRYVSMMITSVGASALKSVGRFVGDLFKSDN